MQHKKGIAAVLAFILLIGPVTPVFANSIDTLRQENEKRQQKMNETQESIQIKESEKNSVLDEIAELDATITNLDENIRVIEGEISVLNDNIEKNKQEIRRLEQRIEENEKLFAERVNVMFKSPKGSYMQVLLSSENLSELLTRGQMMQSLADYDTSLIEALKSDREKLETVKKNLDRDLAELLEKETELQEEKKALEVASEEKGNYVSQLQSQINDQEELIDVLTAEFQQAEGRIAELIEEARIEAERIAAEKRRLEEEAAAAEAARIAAEQAAREAEAAAADEAERAKLEAQERAAQAQNNLDSTLDYASVGDGLAWPVPDSYRITDTFGGRIHPISGVYHHHTGIDVGAATGSTLVAAQSGTVILSAWNGGYGNCVMINHGNGMVTLYGHMNAFYVSSGQWVEKGQSIGEVGNTGLSTGPHLHFEVILNGAKVNPMNYLQ